MISAEELARYDAGLLNDYGGGNVGWWHDYIRYELDRAHEWYMEQYEATAVRLQEIQALCDAANNDAERAVSRSIELERDLKCLQESTVDSKAYDAALSRAEAAEKERDHFAKLWTDSTTAIDRWDDKCTELRARAESLEAENERLRVAMAEALEHSNEVHAARILNAALAQTKEQDRE